MEQKITTPVTKGIIIALILIVISLATYFLGMMENKAMQYVGYIIFIVAIIWSVNAYGKQINYNSTFGNYFAHGFKVTSVITVIMILFTIIFISLFPEIKEKGIDAARKSMQAKGTMSSEQIEQAIGFTQKFFTAFIIGGALVFYLILGAIASLIGAGITKKEPNQIANEINQIGK